MRSVVAVALLASACNTPYLTWTAREPLAARRGQVAYSVDDQRSDKRLGTAFGFGGLPRAIELPADEPRARLTRLMVEALYTSGLAPAEIATTPTARAALELDTLHCDGMRMKAHAQLTAIFTVRSPEGEQRIAPQRWELVGKGRGCAEAFSDVLDKLLDELSAVLVEGPGHDAALGVTISG